MAHPHAARLTARGMRGFRVAEVLRRQRARGGSAGPRGRRELPELRRERGGSPGLVVTRIGGGSGREGSAAVGAPGSMVLRGVCFPEACGGGSLT